MCSICSQVVHQKFPQGWWVTGGLVSNKSEASNSSWSLPTVATELLELPVDYQGNFTEGPDLPFAMHKHCILQIAPGWVHWTKEIFKKDQNRPSWLERSDENATMNSLALHHEHQHLTKDPPSLSSRSSRWPGWPFWLAELPQPPLRQHWQQLSFTTGPHNHGEFEFDYSLVKCISS